MDVDGLNLRRIGRLLDVDHKSVSNWVNAHAARLEQAPVPHEVDKAEFDELLTFVEEKKRRLRDDIG
jgi:hypothetical protein